MSKASENIAIVRKAYGRFFEGDFDGFLESFAENAVIIEAASLPYGGEYRGLDECKRALGLIAGAWDDLSTDIETMLADDNMVAVVGRLKGKAKGTGEPIDMQIVELFRFENDRITAVVPIYGDTHEVVLAHQG